MTVKKRSVASKELAAARRRKRHREVIRNRIIFGIACLAILALIIFGISKLISALFGNSSQVESSKLTFRSDGSVYFEEVTDFDEDIYSKSDLKAYVKDLIASYNETSGEYVISLDDLKVKNSEAYIATTYASYEDYASFTSYPLYFGTIEDASAAGYDFSGNFCEVTDGQKGETVDTDLLTDFAGCYVAVVGENVEVEVPGTVVLVSDTSTEVLDFDEVGIAQADGNEDATDLVYIIFSLEE